MAEISKNILVTGATGAIAPLLVRELIKKNHQVKVLVRQTPPRDLLPESAEIITGDLLDEKILKSAAKDVEWIFHFAAKLHINNPSDDLRSEYEAVNVEATRNLIELSRETCEKFVYASTINVYGTSGGGEIFDETSELKPDGIYAETKAEAEKFVLAKTGGVVLRLAAVYGSRMKGNFPRLARAIKNGRFAFIGDSENRRTLIHEQDVVRAAVLCAETEKSNGEIYNITDGEIHTLKEIVRAIAKAFDKKPPQLKIPIAAVKPAVSFGDILLKLAGKPLDLKNMLEKINEDMAVSGAKIRRELDFKPVYDLENGWRQAVEYLKAQ